MTKEMNTLIEGILTDMESEEQEDAYQIYRLASRLAEMIVNEQYEEASAVMGILKNHFASNGVNQDEQTIGPKAYGLMELFDRYCQERLLDETDMNR